MSYKYYAKRNIIPYKRQKNTALMEIARTGHPHLARIGQTAGVCSLIGCDTKTGGDTR